MYKELNILDKISKENPFEHCKLERLKSAEILTQIVESNKGGMVLALNDKWGSGKTTFVQMWKVYLEEKERYKTIYFNAWENDFDDDPLIAILSEFKNKDISNNYNLKEVLRKAVVLSKYAIPKILDSTIEKTTGVSTSELTKQLVKGGVELLQEEVSRYAERKKGIQEFRLKLQEFIENLSDEKPLIFIVDELDRCKPNYSVQLLELIKHFFSVPNIIFVLSIDKKQLCNSIKGFYGSDSIDSNAYLRRFIDLEYSFPKVDSKLYFNYLYDVLDFKSYFDSEDNGNRHDGREFKYMGEILFNNNDISLRVQEKILIHARISLRMFGLKHVVFPILFLFLVYLKITENDFYESIRRKDLDLESLHEKYFRIVTIVNNSNSNRYLIHLEYLLIKFYNKYLRENSRFLSIDKIENNEHYFHFQSKIDNEILKQVWNHYETTNYYDVDLKYLIDKIEIADDFMT